MERHPARPLAGHRVFFLTLQPILNKIWPRTVFGGILGQIILAKPLRLLPALLPPHKELAALLNTLPAMNGYNSPNLSGLGRER